MSEGCKFWIWTGSDLYEIKGVFNAETTRAVWLFLILLLLCWGFVLVWVAFECLLLLCFGWEQGTYCHRLEFVGFCFVCFSLFLFLILLLIEGVLYLFVPCLFGWSKRFVVVVQFWFGFVCLGEGGGGLFCVVSILPSSCLPGSSFCMSSPLPKALIQCAWTSEPYDQSVNQFRALEVWSSHLWHGWETENFEGHTFSAILHLFIVVFLGLDGLLSAKESVLVSTDFLWNAPLCPMFCILRTTVLLARWFGISLKSGRQRNQIPFILVKPHQRLRQLYFSGCPARHLALKCLYQEWLVQCQFNVTRWDSKFDLPPLPQCGSTQNCLSRSVHEIHFTCCLDVKQPTDNKILRTSGYQTLFISKNLHVHQPYPRLKPPHNHWFLLVYSFQTYVLSWTRPTACQRRSRAASGQSWKRSGPSFRQTCSRQQTTTPWRSSRWRRCIAAPCRRLLTSKMLRKQWVFGR